ncbi:MAG TPA: aldo/keto reductase, partial [Gammaproteobacteria bacterium]|nr:aldo/keto reductase [Gammaproteobacteria bacterium]
DHVLAIPGTRFEDRAKENLDAASSVVSEHVISKAGSILSPESIIGDRWS